MTTNYIKTKTSKKKIPVDYTKKGFNEIKEDLKNYIERYYPDTYQDFNKSSFGSMMLDLVSYIGDQLHYYLDHNANESNPVFAKEAENVFQGLHALGAKPEIFSSTVGHVDAYFAMPADSYGVGLDTNYFMISHAGSKYMTQGGNVFTQISDVIINSQTSEIIGHKSTDDGSKIGYFLLKTKVPVRSGEERQFTVEVSGYRKFLKIEIPDSSVVEVTKIVDSDNNEYVQVDNLSSNIVLMPITDPSSAEGSTLKTRMKPTPVPRRFIVERSLNKTYVIFGHGSAGSLTTNSMVDPSKTALKLTSKEHVSNPRQDPYNILTSNALGVAPQDTTLSITYRANSNANSNAAVGTVNQVIDPILSFTNEQLLDPTKVNYIRENLQVYNEESINGFVTISDTEELKYRYLASYSSQGRAVTAQDYVSAVYSMPSGFGSIKRAAVVRDNNDFRRNLNLYLISESADGKLQAPSMLLKQNVKTWINSMRMISDSVDIFDANIINLSLEFKVQVASNSSAQTILSTIKNKLFEELMINPPDIGEPFSISEVFRILRQVPEVLSVPPRDGVVVRSISNSEKYSSYPYSISSNLSPDESTIYIPENTIWEIKYLDDITGNIILQ